MAILAIKSVESTTKSSVKFGFNKRINFTEQKPINRSVFVCLCVCFVFKLKRLDRIKCIWNDMEAAETWNSHTGYFYSTALNESVAIKAISDTGEAASNSKSTHVVILIVNSYTTTV